VLKFLAREEKKTEIKTRAFYWFGEVGPRAGKRRRG
jgi:hypothetical protein